MQSEIFGDIQAWLIAVLVYPGLLFGVVVGLGVEWLMSLVRPRLSATAFRVPTRPPHPMQPLASFMKLAGRRDPSGLVPLGEEKRAPHSEAIAYFTLAAAAAPLLALALTPLGGNPAVGTGWAGDLIFVILLLVAQPLARALSRLFGDAVSALEGARGVGRLVTGLIPALVAVAALVEASGSGSISLVRLGAAPETGGQFLVRLLAGAALLASLVWWVDHAPGGETAGSLAGRHLQTAALGAFWTAMVVPAPGNLGWGIVVAVLGTLFAAAVIRLLPLIWAPLRAEREAAALVWRTALPVAVVALFISIWSGA